MRLYDELAPWFHLLTAPADYAVEAARYAELALDACPDASTLLELGAGGGNNASHLTAHFACTLTDVAPAMLELSAQLNPECEHIVGDMRTLRLDRVFDVVFVHDAVAYLTTEDDLAACLLTAAVHTAPGGVAVIAPDYTAETFVAGTEHGGHDGADGRSLRYLEWVHERAPGATTYRVDYAVLLCGDGAPTRVVHDHHVEGVFPQATWVELLLRAGFDQVRIEPGDADDPDRSQVVFVARRRPDGDRA
jgi:hypothetical protein